MAEKDERKAHLVLKVEFAKKELAEKQKAFDEAVKELGREFPMLAADYSWRLR